jgi:hypothetical protein
MRRGAYARFMFVIERMPDGAFLSSPGMLGAYTKDLTKARTFKTHGSATAACSGSERPIDVEYLLQRPR